MSAIHNNEAVNEVTGNEIIMSRLLNAPRELVWEVFTDPKHLANWWGPFGFTITTHHMEMAVGKNWHLTMHGPDGTNYPNLVVYSEVVKPEKLVFKNTLPDDPEKVFHVTTITFKEEGNKTRVRFVMSFPNLDELKAIDAEYGAVEGGMQTLSRMEEYLVKLQAV